MSTLTAKQKTESVGVYWPTVGEYGLVPILSVVRSPYNPRKHFGDEETAAIAGAIKASGQREIATVRELTQEEIATKYPDARYMLTSGERRWRGAVKAGATHFEIRVRAYTNRAAEKLDAFMLNEDRVQLSDIENAWAIADLMEEHGWKTQVETAEAIRRDQVWVSQTLSLLRCSTKVQDLMHPRLKQDDRLSKQVGVFLAKLHPEKQDELIENMPRELRTATAQMAWMQKELNEQGVALERRERQPITMRRILMKLASSTSVRISGLLDAPEFSRLFENTRDTDADDLAIQMRNTLIQFEKLVERVEHLSLGEKKVTVRNVASVVPKPATPTPATLAPVMQPAPGKAVAVPVAPPARRQRTADHVRDFTPMVRRGVPEKRLPTAESVSRAAVVGVSEPVARTRITVTHWHETACRFVMDSVDFRKFAELWDNGLLKFQKEGTPKPENYPDRKDICGL